MNNISLFFKAACMRLHCERGIVILYSDKTTFLYSVDLLYWNPLMRCISKRCQCGHKRMHRTEQIKTKCQNYIFPMGKASRRFDLPRWCIMLLLHQCSHSLFLKMKDKFKWSEDVICLFPLSQHGSMKKEIILPVVEQQRLFWDRRIAI